MLPKSWEEYLASLERDIKKTASPTKRRQPRVRRMQSKRMLRISSQTANTVRASYYPERVSNSTPTKPVEWKGTLNIGGSCEVRSNSTGKDTTSRNPKGK